MRIRAIVGASGLMAGIALIACTGIVLYLHTQKSSHKCGFPVALRQSIGELNLYCPDTSLVPEAVQEYSSKATTGNGALLYPVRDRNTELSVSLQKKPSKEQLDNFKRNVLPLSIDVETKLGKGIYGVSKGQLLLSLPTNTQTWILITAPENYDSQRLVVIAKSFVSD